MSDQTPSDDNVGTSTGRNLPWYFGGHAAWYGANGLLMVLFPYLTAFVLGLDARYIGIAQVALMGPGLLLLMPGGVIADHLDERGYLIKLHLLASLPPLVMAGVLISGQISFTFLISYAIVAGSLSTLAIPARDSLLNHLTPHDQLNRLVALSIALQFGGQLVGMVAAGYAAVIGPAPFFIIHSCVMLAGAFSLQRLHIARHDVAHTPLGADLRVFAKRIAEAGRVLLRSNVLAPVMICNSAIGLFFVGSFMVSVPIFARDVFQGTGSDIAIFHVSFFLGTVISALVIMRLGTIHNRGKVIILGLSLGTVICFTLTREVSFTGFALLMFAWGLGAGAVMTLSRTIIQEAAPDHMRARMLASFQMGIMGFGPLGSLVTGFAIDAVGPRNAMFIPGFGMAAVLICVVLFTGLWRLTNRDTAK